MFHGVQHLSRVRQTRSFAIGDLKPVTARVAFFFFSPGLEPKQQKGRDVFVSLFIEATAPKRGIQSVQG